PDDSTQPYTEIHPGEPGFENAVAAAETRLATFHAGSRPFESIPRDDPAFYNYRGRYAATMDATDISDPEIDGVCTLTPFEKETPLINVPTHPHWVSLDLTIAPGAWVPRRSDWQDILVNGNIPPPVDACGRDPAIVTTKYEDLKGVVDLIRSMKLDDVRAFAEKEEPMGLWLDKAEC